MASAGRAPSSASAMAPTDSATSDGNPASRGWWRPIDTVLLAAGLPIALVSLFVLCHKVLALKPLAPVFLSDLRPTSASQDWGQLGLDRSVAGNGLSIGRARYPKGLGTHANSRVCYALDGQYRAFAAGVGLDSETGRHGGEIVFRVRGDRRLLYESPALSRASEPLPVLLDLRGVKELCLIVAEGGDGIANDHADWGGARLLR
jgi:hypothetical protein